MSEKKPESPNKALDDAIKKLMKKLDNDEEPVLPETAVKILNTAISWEKVKAGMLSRGDDFDPDSL